MRLYNIDINSIGALCSSNPQYIKLPYKWESTPMLEREKILAEIANCRVPKPSQIKDITVLLSLTPCKREIFAQLHICIATTSGKIYQRIVAAEIDPTQAEKVLRDYIVAGMPGLEAKHAETQKKYFNQYVEDNRSGKADQIISYLRAGISIDDVLFSANI